MKYIYLLAIGLFFTSCSQKVYPTLYDYDVEKRLEELGIELESPGNPVANYVNAVTSNSMVYLAGKGPQTDDKKYITGKVSQDLSVEDAYKAARKVGITQLASLKQEIGDLNRVVRIVKVVGMVNAPADFTQHSSVINGYSDLMVEVFGERGKHARVAVGMVSLPLDMACEIEMIVEIQGE